MLNAGVSLKEAECFPDRQFENIGYIFLPEFHLQRFLIKSLSFALFTGDLHVSHEMHADFYIPGSFTVFTASPGNIERKPAFIESIFFCHRLLRKKITNMV